MNLTLLELKTYVLIGRTLQWSLEQPPHWFTSLASLFPGWFNLVCFIYGLFTCMNGSFWAMIYHKYPPWNSPQGVSPASCSYKARGLAKSLQNEWVQVNISPHKMGGLCATTSPLQHPHFVGRPYILPGCLISIFFWVWVLLAASTLIPKKASFCKEPVALPFPGVFLNCL